MIIENVTEESSSAREEKERVEQRNRWLKRWQSWAEMYGIPSGISLPASMKFQVRDLVAQILQKRSMEDSRYDLEDLLKEEINKWVIQPLLQEQEAKKKEAEAEKKKVEAEKKKEYKINLIRQSLVEVDNFIKEENLESHVTFESKTKLKGYIYDALLKGLSEHISIPPTKQVRQILNEYFAATRQKIKEAEEQAIKEKQKKARIEHLVAIGMNELLPYIRENQKDLEPLDYEEKIEAGEYLQKVLREEIKGDEIEQEIRDLSIEILDEFFFPEEDEDENEEDEEEQEEEDEGDED